MRFLVVGAGVTTPMIVQALLARSNALGIYAVTIYDPAPKRLETIRPLLIYMQQRHPIVRIDQFTDLEEAVRGGVDCCIISIRPGLERGRTADEERARDIGYLANETVGAAGLAFACRTIPAATNVASAVVTRNPSCLIVNFTNPAGLVTAALNQRGFTEAVGVCSSAEKAYRLLARLPEMSRAKALVFGLNHLSWTYSINLDSSEFLPTVLRSDNLLTVSQPWFHGDLPRSYGALLNEYLYYYCCHEEALDEQREKGQTRGAFVEAINARARRALLSATTPEDARRIYLDYVTKRKNGAMSRSRGQAGDAFHENGYSSAALPVIEGSLLRLDRQVTIISTGHSLDAVPRTVALEATTIFSRGARTTLYPEHFPTKAMALLRTMAAYEQTALQAIEARSKAGLIEALNINPLTTNKRLNELYIGRTVAAWPKVFAGWT